MFCGRLYFSEKVLNLQYWQDHLSSMRSLLTQIASAFVCFILATATIQFYLSQPIIRVEWHVKEGDTFEPVKHIATVKGKARFLLLGERVALNLLARCSGIATKSINHLFFGPISHYGISGRKESKIWQEVTGSTVSQQEHERQLLVCFHEKFLKCLSSIAVGRIQIG